MLCQTSLLCLIGDLHIGRATRPVDLYGDLPLAEGRLLHDIVHLNARLSKVSVLPDCGLHSNEMRGCFIL